MAGLTTYWCHECDMSVSLKLPPSPFLCPHGHTHFLELMDSPTLSQNDTKSFLFVVVFQDAILLLNPLSSKPCPLPSLHVTPPSSPPLTPATSFVASSAKTKLPPSLKPNNYPTNTYTTLIASRRWLELHASCSLCKFRLEEEEEKGDDGIMTKIKRKIIVRLTEEDFYGLRTTLNHIASRHALIEENENRGPQIGKKLQVRVVTRQKEKERFSSMKANENFRISYLLDKIYNSKI
ncbi:hypothetical protein JHK87_017991 [Glycine soja]|nr:hypothetical protein JHK87_017991 [Glycine soja]